MLSFLARTPANNIWKMYVIRLLYWMHFVSSVLIPFFRDWGGLSFTGIMLLNAWFMLWNFLLEIPTGTVADVWGRRTSVALAFVVAAAGVLIYVSRPEFMIFLVDEVFIVFFRLLCGLQFVDSEECWHGLSSLPEEAQLQPYTTSSKCAMTYVIDI